MKRRCATTSITTWHFIETDFLKTKHEAFDPEYMKALFDYAFAKGRRGYAWHKAPPLYEVEP